MYKVSEHANQNYLCRTFKLEESQVSKHPNADKLSIVEVDFLPVISNNPEVGRWYVYFPTESVVNQDLLSHANLYREGELNKDPEVTGFFEKNSRVKTIKLRGEISSGFILPLNTLKEFMKADLPEEEAYFDTINDTLLIKKYYKDYSRPSSTSTGGVKGAPKKTLEALGVIPGAFRFHEDTDNLRKESFKIRPETFISVTNKLHGSSAIVANLPSESREPPKWWQKLLRLPGKKVDGYLNIYSSRKVIKNLNESGGFYEEDIWKRLNEDIKHLIPKGYTIYGEIIGYMKNGNFIQKDYDYGLKQGDYAFVPYRITVLDKEGNHVELSSAQVNDFVKYNLSSVSVVKPMDIIFSGKMMDHYSLMAMKLHNEDYIRDLVTYLELTENKTNEEERQKVLKTVQYNYIKMLEHFFTEKDCPLCSNKVPEEGIVVRREQHVYSWSAFKLKSLRFMQKESDMNDKGVSNVEDQESSQN